VPIVIKTVSVYNSTDNSRDLFVEWGITLCFILQKSNVRGLQDSSGPEQGPVVGCYEQNNKRSESIKDSKFLYQLIGSFSSEFKCSCFRTENKLIKVQKMHV
jgi:hypothetical protein